MSAIQAAQNLPSELARSRNTQELEKRKRTIAWNETAGALVRQTFVEFCVVVAQSKEGSVDGNPNDKENLLWMCMLVII